MKTLRKFKKNKYIIKEGVKSRTWKAYYAFRNKKRWLSKKEQVQKWWKVVLMLASQAWKSTWLLGCLKTVPNVDTFPVVTKVVRRKRKSHEKTIWQQCKYQHHKLTSLFSYNIWEKQRNSKALFWFVENISLTLIFGPQIFLISSEGITHRKNDLSWCSALIF